ncbi:MAG TPA: MIP/aquaporin family protein [Candidatus Limnocylindrales bacterium]|jgi:glycerol uptake facilitator protein
MSSPTLIEKLSDETPGVAVVAAPTLIQKLGAEALGTAILVFIGAGSVPLTVFLTGNNPFGSAELSTISFCFAFAIFAAVYAVGHISGAHINPAVTIALAASKKIDWTTAAYYIVAQVVGALIGAALTLAVLSGNDPAKLGLGSVGVNANAGLGVGVLAEVIGTAILVFTVFGAAVDGRAPAGFAGVVIGFIVYGIIILVGPITGAALNPARQVGPVILEAIIGFGKASDRIAQLWVYIVGPIVGGLVGAGLYQFIGRQTTESAPSVVRTTAAAEM